MSLLCVGFGIGLFVEWPGMPDESRTHALDPDLLTVEIGLLLDYLSGLPERTLTDPAACPAPARLHDLR